jgi:hypothetical protein
MNKSLLKAENGDNRIIIFLNKLFEKKIFIFFTFLNLLFQLSISFYIMKNTNLNFTFYKKVLLYLTVLILLIILILFSMPTYLRLFLFIIFSILFGFILSILKLDYDDMTVNLWIRKIFIIYSVIFILGLIFLFMEVNFDYKYKKPLFYALLTVIGLDTISLLLDKTSIVYQFISLSGLLLTSSYIIFDTNRFFNKGYNGDFITASFDYFLDIIYYIEFITPGLHFFLDILNFFNSILHP